MGRTKEITITQAMAHIGGGARLMVSGFLGCGTPYALVDALFDSGIADLTIIANDGATAEEGVGKLIAHRRVKRLIASHIGTNPEAGRQMTSGELDVELVPQGTLVERIRAGGAGLGGVITPTGVGTVVEEGKRTIELEGRKYLIELPLRADVALIRAEVADEMGNLIMYGTARNTGPLMATAADIVICEVTKIVPVGELDPERVTVPGLFVDYLVRGGCA